mmetsp:Transcript_80415/g.167479  ORF Transcript_80415/g.167479 Transcript_80415/m.167479 type:complete len:300 (-) Transcript_80415:210-1109(-)
MAIVRAYGATTFKEEKRIALERAHLLEREANSLKRSALFEEFRNDLKDASLELRSDFEVACAHINHYASWVLRCASDSLKSNKDVVLRAVRLNPWALQFAGDSIRADREVILEAVKKDGYALRYASKELRNDRDIVLAAVRQATTLDAARTLPKQPQDLMLRALWSSSLDWNARAVYSEAADKLRMDLSWDDFRIIAKSAIASPGESAPIASAALLSSTRESYRFEVAMLSGNIFACSVPCPTTAASAGPVVDDLARQIVKLLPKHTEVKAANRVYLLLDGSDVLVSAWDATRPLSDLC